MSFNCLKPEDLLAGGTAVFDLKIPESILNPGKICTPKIEKEKTDTKDMFVKLKPLTIQAFQLIMKAAANDTGMIPLLMIKAALVEPKLSMDQIKQFHLGLVDFLIGHIRKISGLTEKKTLKN